MRALLLLLLLSAASAVAADLPPEARQAWVRGHSLLDQGLKAEALEPLRDAASQAPSSAVVIHRDYQDLMRTQGSGQAVVEEYRQRSAEAPNDANLRFLFGRSTGDPATARREYEAGLAQEPDNKWCRQGLGGVAAAEGKLDEALQHYNAALALDPAFAEVHNKLANIHLARQDRPAAKAAWRAAMAADPADYHAYMNLGAVLSTEGDLPGATELLRAAAERAPGNPLAHVNLGYVLFKQAQYDDALAHFAVAEAVNPRDRSIAAARGLVEQVRSGAIPAEVLPPYEKALAASSTDPKLAIQHFKEVLLLAPNFAWAHQNLALAHSALGELEPAEAALRKAAELAPDDPAVRFNLGYLLLNLRKLPDAEAELRAAWRLDPTDVDALANLALAELGQGKVDDSLAHYREALGKRPGDPVLHLQESTALLAAGDIDASIQSARNALNLAPDFYSARTQLVSVLAEARRFDDALAELTWLEKAAPDHPDLRVLRAKLEAAGGAQADKAGRIRLSRILLDDAALAQKLAGGGGDFAALARTHGTGPERGRNGDIGYVDPGELRPELSAAVRDLSVGEVSAAVDLGGRWVILKRTE